MACSVDQLPELSLELGLSETLSWESLSKDERVWCYFGPSADRWLLLYIEVPPL